MNETWETMDGWRIEVRPIRADDEALWLEFMHAMSWPTRYKRGARRVDQLTDADVKRAMRPQSGTELAYVAVASRGAERLLAGVSRGTFREAGTCEFTLVVGDAWQGRGLGTRLMHALMDAAATRGRGRIVGRVLATNGNMLDFVRALGFAVEEEPGEPALRRVVCQYAPPAAPGPATGQT